jgi:hypothetical protein
MPTIRVFDPALCCSSGVCGVEVDQALVTFAADAAWMAAQGHALVRHNLAQEPTLFAAEPAVVALLHADGERALPAFLVDGELRMNGRYPTRAELAAWVGLAYVAPAPRAPRRSLGVLPVMEST